MTDAELRERVQQVIKEVMDEPDAYDLKATADEIISLCREPIIERFKRELAQEYSGRP